MVTRPTGRRRAAALVSGSIIAMSVALGAAGPVSADTTTIGSYPGEFTAVAGRVYFRAGGYADDEVALWRTDGTRAGTRMVRTFAPWPFDLTAMGGKLWFLARSADGSPGLWTSDGTAAGTRSIRDFGALDDARPILLTRVGRRLFFVLDRCLADSGAELWTSDGTNSGTIHLRTFRCRDTFGDVDPPGDLVAVGDRLFLAVDTKASGSELWTSDGTPGGTRLVRDIRPGSKGSDPRPLGSLHGRLLFWADDGTHGTALWRTDGTEGGTRLVKDVDPSGAGILGATTPASMDAARLGRRLFFTAWDGARTGLWATDGTGPGTRRVRVIPGGAGQLVGAVGRLYFVGTDGTAGAELWISDGTASGTHRIRDIRPGPRGSDITALMGFEEAAFFIADDGTHGLEPWVSDGTAAGTHLVKDIAPGPEPGWGCLFDDSVGGGIGLAFLAAEDGDRGCEPWRSDGTRAGTRLLRDLATP